MLSRAHALCSCLPTPSSQDRLRSSQFHGYHVLLGESRGRDRGESVPRSCLPPLDFVLAWIIDSIRGELPFGSSSVE